jgi:hypothetical protein
VSEEVGVVEKTKKKLEPSSPAKHTSVHFAGDKGIDHSGLIEQEQPVTSPAGNVTRTSRCSPRLASQSSLESPLVAPPPYKSPLGQDVIDASDVVNVFSFDDGTKTQSNLFAVEAENKEKKGTKLSASPAKHSVHFEVRKPMNGEEVIHPKKTAISPEANVSLI